MAYLAAVAAAGDYDENGDHRDGRVRLVDDGSESDGGCDGDAFHRQLSVANDCYEKGVAVTVMSWSLLVVEVQLKVSQAVAVIDVRH